MWADRLLKVRVAPPAAARAEAWLEPWAWPAAET